MSGTKKNQGKNKMCWCFFPQKLGFWMDFRLPKRFFHCYLVLLSYFLTQPRGPGISMLQGVLLMHSVEGPAER